MTLGEFTCKSMDESLKDMELVECKPHTNDNGEIQSVELKYVPRDIIQANRAQENRGRRI